jgi:transcriptional regulator with XRE-family HTH domain
MKPIPAELSAKIDEAKSWMFDGDQKEVAKRSGQAESRVSQVLNKRIAPDKSIIKYAVEVMNENKLRFEISPIMKAS